MKNADMPQITNIRNMDGEYDYHFHMHFEILFFCSGNAKVFSDGYEQTMKPGSYCVIPPFCPHKLAYSNCHMTKISFPMSYIDRYLTKETTQTLHQYYSTRISINSTSTTDAINNLSEDLESGLTDRAYIYIFKILSNCRIIPESNLKNTRLADIMTYIGFHSYGKIALEEIADGCGITKYHICRLFKAKLGITPVEYITFARIRRAIKILLTTGHTIARISKELDFYSPNYFTTLFKSYFGMLPSEFRKNADHLSEERYYLNRKT